MRGVFYTALLIAFLLAALTPVARFLNRPEQSQFVLTLIRALISRSESTRQDPRSAVYAADLRTVFSSALDLLSEQKISVRDRSERLLFRGRVPLVPKKGLIRTSSVKVDQKQLRELVAERFRPLVDRRGRRGGRYVLTIRMRSVRRAETRVSVEPLIVITLWEPSSAQGGVPLPSSMRLEAEFLAKLATKVPRSR